MSIIICTYNRADHLKETLNSIRRLCVPKWLTTELIVVDNASTDHTADVVCSSNIRNMNVIYICNKERGKANAINAGIAASQGKILLWTDDDVRVPPDWIVAMSEPLLTGAAQGVAGKIRIAPSLERPWMQRTHYDRIADTRFMGDDFGAMIGANMAFHRDVLKTIPAFDPELGPGALGLMEDTLFSLQMCQAGYKIAALTQVYVEHYFEPSRLTRKAWLETGEKAGRSEAYLDYHWAHKRVVFPRLQMLMWGALLACFRVLHRPAGLDAEECDRREIRLFQNCCYMQAYLKERKLPPKYEKYGFVKRKAA